MSTINEVRQKLREHFSVSTENHGERWDQLWSEGDFLPWDKGFPNPALVDLLTEREDLVLSLFVDDNGMKRRKRALVPGCGRGYDVLLLASFGYDAYGLEISENAIREAYNFAQEAKDYDARNPSIGKGQAKFIHGDFFTDEFLKEVNGNGTFELLYDYTVRYSALKIPKRDKL